ncbi:MAG: type II toxin-antitoxin system prevent-host-death family antitoxin [Eubacterium sp.]|nr:type II toxin-antitoxin system prevent-host-death family antitoxin [Eubacterium sp.]
MSITATELKQNLGKYLILAEKEDIYITQYGKVIAKLTSPHQTKRSIAESLIGSMPDTMTLEEAKKGRGKEL